MRDKKFLYKKICAVVAIIILIALIIFPIILQEIIEANKDKEKARAYSYIDSLEKQLVLNENKINGEKININTIKVKTKVKKPLKGTVTILDNKVESAELLIDKYTIMYKNNQISKINPRYKYYIKNNKKSDKINDSWKIYVKEIFTFNGNIENSSHILRYKYKKNDYSIVLSNKKECDLTINRISKLKGYNDFSCVFRDKDKYIINQLCAVFDERKTICYDSNSWNNSKKIKRNLEKSFGEKINCSLNSKKLYCEYHSGEYILNLTINDDGSLILSSLDTENYHKCSLSKNDKVSCY